MKHWVLLLSTHFIFYPSMHFLWTPLVENYIFGDLKSPLMHFSGLAVPFCKGVSWRGRGRGRKEANLKKKKKKNKKTWGKGKHVLLTSHLVHQDAWGNDASILREELLQFFLSHGFWQATDVQICISDGGGAWTGIGNLQADTGHMTITTSFGTWSNELTCLKYKLCEITFSVIFVHTNRRRADAVNNF